MSLLRVVCENLHRENVSVLWDSATHLKLSFLIHQCISRLVTLLYFYSKNRVFAAFLDCMQFTDCFSSTTVFLCLLRGKTGVHVLSRNDLTFALSQATIQPLSETEIAQLQSQLGDRFIPHKYYRQIWNTRKQRTQE